MTEKTEVKGRKIDQIFESSEKVYAEEMQPLIIEGIKGDFHATLIEAKKMLSEMKQTEWKNFLSIADGGKIDVDSLADDRVSTTFFKQKIEEIKDLYRELFNEDLV